MFTRKRRCTRTVNSLIIENEPAAVLNFLSGSQWLQLSSILRHLMIFSVLNSRHSRHSRHSRRRRRGSVARSVSPAWGGAPAHRRLTEIVLARCCGTVRALRPPTPTPGRKSWKSGRQQGRGRSYWRSTVIPQPKRTVLRGAFYGAVCRRSCSSCAASRKWTTTVASASRRRRGRSASATW